MFCLEAIDLSLVGHHLRLGNVVIRLGRIVILLG